MGVLHGLVDFGLLQVVFWLFTQLFGKVLLVFHLNREQPGVRAALQDSPVSVGLVGRRTKVQELEGVHWNKDYFKNDLAWKENLHLFDI